MGTLPTDENPLQTSSRESDPKVLQAEADASARRFLDLQDHLMNSMDTIGCHDSRVGLEDGGDLQPETEYETPVDAGE